MKKYFYLIFLLNFTQIFSQESLTDKAITEMQNSNYQKAILLFDKAILKNPKDKEAYQYRAETKYELKNLKGALTDINVAIKLDSLCASCFQKRAEIYYKTNRLKECVNDYEKAFEIWPALKKTETYYELAISKQKTNTKPSVGTFQPTLKFVELIINNNYSFKDFYTVYYDNIESFSEESSLTYNEKTKNHDIPSYEAVIIIKYKNTKIYFTINSTDKNEPIKEITMRFPCVCEWFNGNNELKINGYKEMRRDDEGNGTLQIWSEKQNFQSLYHSNMKKLNRYITITKK